MNNGANSGLVDVLANRQLGEAQLYVLRMLDPEWDGKPDARAVSVLRSLERRGLACHTEWPRECWSITDEGRAARARMEPQVDEPAGMRP